ncbi:MAG: S24 family peptidase, partial [Planctomycetes bacterium]|nr:S24 family peptidase [Planctomycetota bacterium]
TTTSITRERVMASTGKVAMVGSAPVSATQRPIPFVALKADGKTSTGFDEYPSGDTDVIECPPDIKDTNAFAVRVDSDEMEPLIPRGALAIVAPGLPQRENKPVLVKLASGEMLCRRYQAKRNTVILAPCNTNYEVRLVDAGDVEWIYPVVRVSIDLYNDPVALGRVVNPTLPRYTAIRATRFERIS